MGASTPTTIPLRRAGLINAGWHGTPVRMKLRTKGGPPPSPCPVHFEEAVKGCAGSGHPGWEVVRALPVGVGDVELVVPVEPPELARALWANRPIEGQQLNPLAVPHHGEVLEFVVFSGPLAIERRTIAGYAG